MIEVYILWSERDRLRSSSKEILSPPDLSAIRSGVSHLNDIKQQQQQPSTKNKIEMKNDSLANDKEEEVNLDDPYPYQDVEDYQNNYSSNLPPIKSIDGKRKQSSSTTTFDNLHNHNRNNSINKETIKEENLEKPIITIIQPPPTPEFLPPPSPTYNSNQSLQILNKK